MRRTMNSSLMLATILLGGVLLAAPAPLFAGDTTMTLSWKDLVPKNAPVATKPKTFFSGATPADPNAAEAGTAASGDASTPAPDPIPEGKFMQQKRRQPGQGRPPQIVPELDGKTVSIGGYIVPLDFEATNVKEFLLVPFVGACIHVPPPPANQIIYVKAEKGFEVGGTFDPVTVTGTIKTTIAFTGLADAGYTLEASNVEARTE